MTQSFWSTTENTKPLFTLSTCGTSLLTNGLGPEDRKLLIQHANASEQDLPPVVAERIRTLAQERTHVFADMNWQDAKHASAELNGVLSYLELFPGRARGAMHALLVSSTFQGQLVGEALQQWFMAQQYSAFVLPIPDIVTAPLERFQSGLCELVDYCSRELQPERQYIVFNVTGGFKSIQGFVQTLGMFYADECISIFEGQGALLRIPRLPAFIDAVPLIRDHVALFRRLDAGSVLLEQTRQIPETLLTVIGDEATLSGWGKLMWDQAKGFLYGERICPVTSAKMRLDERFQASCAGLDPARLRLVNRRLDDLMRHLESPQGQNLRSLDFKPLHGGGEAKRRLSGMTHEFDAWSDLDAKRGFGFFDEDSVFVVVQLADALH